ncbi:hypothetical protein IV01_17055 [Pseudomonas syringae]|uniref:Uncharacterized protein n=1 Tax=Pseudomonas syringae TaxID=317 RepID=A0A085VFJ6_PSESX|nr:hypothetical protein IV01_17055 [Pseudomonas syringae]
MRKTYWYQYAIFGCDEGIVKRGYCLMKGDYGIHRGMLWNCFRQWFGCNAVGAAKAGATDSPYPCGSEFIREEAGRFDGFSSVVILPSRMNSLPQVRCFLRLCGSIEIWAGLMLSRASALLQFCVLRDSSREGGVAGGGREGLMLPVLFS